jgi:hypothetical protein
MPLLPIMLGVGLIVLLSGQKKAQAGAPARPPQPGVPAPFPSSDCIPPTAAALSQVLSESEMTPEQLGQFALDLELLGFPAAANCLRAILQGQSELDCRAAVATALEHDIRGAGPEKLEVYAVILQSAGRTGAATCLVELAKQRRGAA